MATPPKSKVEQNIDAAVEVAKWIRSSAVWAGGVALAIIFIATVAREYGLSWRYLPTMAWQSLAFAGVVYWTIR